MNAYYTLYIGRDKQFYWNLKAPNHQIIAQGEGYTTKQNALNGISNFQKYAGTGTWYDET
jgi:uncharacterized protein YegP (UPF0339 family)